MVDYAVHKNGFIEKHDIQMKFLTRPADGGSYETSSVRLSVCPSVRPSVRNAKFSYFPPLDFSEARFSKNNVLAQIWAQIRPRMRFLDDISGKNH